MFVYPRILQSQLLSFDDILVLSETGSSWLAGRFSTSHGRKSRYAVSHLDIGVNIADRPMLCIHKCQLW